MCDFPIRQHGERDACRSLNAWRWAVRSCLLATLLALAGSHPLLAEQLDAYFAADIWTGTGEHYQDGVMLVRDGRIAAVGTRSEIALPANCVLHALGEQTMIPGLVVAETSLLRGRLDSREAIAPELIAWDAFDFFEERDDLLAAGITTVQVAPGQSRLLPGQGSPH